MPENILEMTSNPFTIPLDSIQVIDYNSFVAEIDILFVNNSVHCLNYFAVPSGDKYIFYCAIADDAEKTVKILAHQLPMSEQMSLNAISAKHFPFHIFEREIAENYGVEFVNHPWDKPVRYAADRKDKTKVMDNYPFFSIDGDELHLVGVGPIHAGVIEPGHFKFICNGENVLHLEIHLGYQHRGVEKQIVTADSILKQAAIAESIAGDTAVGHSLAYSLLMESLSGDDVLKQLSVERMIAMEMERIAVHIGDTAAICADIAYQFGQVTCEALRTIIINTTQSWCGNRFGKGLVRPGGTNYPLTEEIVDTILDNLQEVNKRYSQVADRLFSLPSALARFEAIGKVTTHQAELLGAVGMAARSSGLKRDIRWSHPFLEYANMNYEPILKEKCDVWSRAKLRVNEVELSLSVIYNLMAMLTLPYPIASPDYDMKLKPKSLSLSLVEGWRGEICHAAITDEAGKIIYYKIKDPSMHNWMALAMAVRNQEISDFPLCNKSYNLSYCGYDL